MKSQKRKWQVFGLCLLLLIPLLGFGISNLFLRSPKGRIWFSEKIHQKTQLESSIQKASWSPWNGLTVYGLRIEQPELLKEAFNKPLLKVSRIRLVPKWKYLLKQSLQIHSLDITDSELTLPVELLSALPRTENSPAPTRPTIVSNLPTARPLNSLPKKTTAKEKTLPSTTPQQPPAQKVIITEISAKPSTPVWLNLKGAKLSIVSTFTKESLLSISQINGRIPLDGSKIESNISLKEISSYGKTISENLSIPVQLEKNKLNFGSVQTNFKGFDLELAAHLMLTPEIPFSIVAQLPTRENSEIKPAQTASMNIATASARASFKGALLSPSTWQGKCIAEASDLHLQLAENHADFDHARAVIIYQNGALSCIDARLIGEALSVLGNASLLSDGRIASVTRFVAPKQTLLSISKYAPQGTTGAPPALTRLHTQQRSALDLQVFGKIGQLYLKAHPAAKPISLNRKAP